MLPVLTAQEMAQLDRYTIEQLGLSGRILMATASRETLAVLRARWPDCRHPLILAGPGNNGGDAVALAYYAQAAGLSPTLLLCQPDDAAGPSVPPALSADSAYFLGVCERSFVPIQRLSDPGQLAELAASTQSELLVDGLFGTGLDRPLLPYYIELIAQLNQLGLPVLALDTPSGLDCTTGNIHGAAVCAACTVTMGHMKRGFYHPQAAALTGEMVTADLGFAPLADAAVEPSSHAWPDALWEPLRHSRAAQTHKGDYGRVLVVAGHAFYPGAPRLAAQAALRSGAGLVRLVVPRSIHAVCSDHPSVMTAAHPEDGFGGFAAQPDAELLGALDWCDALVLGPGIGADAQPLELARTLLDNASCPVVLDADGLRVLYQADAPAKQWPLLLTPHLGELARLAGVKAGALDALHFGLTLAQAQRHNALVLGKSNQCVLAAPSGALLFPHAGHPALATGGSGDVLAGMLGALLARWHSQARNGDAAAGLLALREITAAEIVCTAVNWHSAAAHRWVARHGDNGMTAPDLIAELPDALEELRGRTG